MIYYLITLCYIFFILAKFQDNKKSITMSSIKYLKSTFFYSLKLYFKAEFMD